MGEITTTDELRTVYRKPAGGALAKQHPSIDDHDRRFIAHSPFVVISTADAAGGCDVSPKGGPPGFVTVLDDGTVVIPDLAGNNRLDTMENLLDNAGIGLLFLIPGIDETLRVNGRARLSTDAEVLAASAVDGVVPRVAIAVDVDEVFLHCGKALRRSGLWRPERWGDTTGLSVMTMIRDQAAPGVDVEVVEQALEDSYTTTLWEPGG